MIYVGFVVYSRPCSKFIQMRHPDNAKSAVCLRSGGRIRGWRSRVFGNQIFYRIREMALSDNGAKNMDERNWMIGICDKYVNLIIQVNSSAGTEHDVDEITRKSRKVKFDYMIKQHFTWDGHLLYNSLFKSIVL